MKINFTQHFNIQIKLFSMSIGLMLSQACFAATMPVVNFNKHPVEGEPAKKSRSKSFYSHNNSSVKIFPDAIKRAIHVVAKGNKGTEIDFFVFDMQATLIRNYKLKDKEQVKIQGLARGTYVYRVFCGDEETASGNFTIK